MGDRHMAVVGAGPGGLAAAMLLAHRGFRGTAFEKRGQVGGRSAALPLERLYPQACDDNVLNSFGQAQQEHSKEEIARAFPGSEAAFEGLYGRESVRVHRHSVGAGAAGSRLHYRTG